MAAEPIKVTVSDPESGDVLGEQIIANDYSIVCAGTCHIAHLATHANGTHVLTIKGRGHSIDEPASGPPDEDARH